MAADQPLSSYPYYTTPTIAGGKILLTFMWASIAIILAFQETKFFLGVAKAHGIGCSGFFGLFGCVQKVVLPDVSPVSVAGIFRTQPEP